MSSVQASRKLQEAVWNGSLPLQIRLSPGDSRVYEDTDPFYVHAPRLSYLPFLVAGLHRFFAHYLIDHSASPSSVWFSFEGVPLKWHHPIGLLYDLFSGSQPVALDQRHHGSKASPSSRNDSSLPWRLEVHYSDFPSDQLVPLDDEGKVLHDAFINSVKEADFLRNGTGNAIMKLSKDDSTALWDAVQNHDLSVYTSIYSKLLPATSSLRHIPIRIYLPSSTSPVEALAQPTSPSPGRSPSKPSSPNPERPATPLRSKPTPGHLKVVQSLVPPFLPSTREAQTLGTALNSMLPALFPSRRSTVWARPVMHGAVVPMTAVVEELMRKAAYSDGWINLSIEMKTS